MEKRTITHEVIDNEGSKVSVFETLDLFWTESEIFIIRNNEPLPYKTTAVVGPYKDAMSALNSISGKTQVKEMPIAVLEQVAPKKTKKNKKESNE